MYKLKIKRSHKDELTTKFFSSAKEVAEFIAKVCSSKNIEDVLKSQKEYNYRFYVTHSSKY